MKSVDPVVDYYSRTAASYDRRFDRPFGGRVHEVEVKFIRANVPRGATVLEFGAGTGRITAELVRLTDRVTVTEPSEPMLTQLRARLSGTTVTTVSTRIEELHRVAGYGSFDVVVGLHVLPHVADIPAALSVLARAMRPRGTMIFDLWNSVSPYTALRQVVRRPNPVLTRYQRQPEMLGLISRAGLRVRSHVAWGFPLGPFPGLSLEVFGRAGTHIVTHVFARWAYGHLFATEFD